MQRHFDVLRRRQTALVARRALVALLLVPAAVPAAGRVAAQDGPAPSRSAIEGTVYDTVSNTPLRLTVVRVAGSDASSLTNDDGRFRIEVPSGQVELQVRRIGYAPTSVAVEARDRVVRRDIYLHPVAIEFAPVTVTAGDDLARRLIRAAIARKHAVFAAIHDYRYDAYVKFVVRDLEKPQDSAASVLLISETRTSAYWEQPDRYQETILARRQSSNFDAEDNLITVGEIVNFHRDRVDLGQYSVVSPVADDALDHYDYRVLDTLAVEGRRVYRLAIQPKSRATPLFIGVIDIADSTHDVLGVDVGPNEAVFFSFLKHIRYRQRLRDAGGDRWAPYEIRLTGELHFGVPLPGIPEHLSFEHVASLEAFRFDEGRRPPDLSEVRVVVGARADRPDSAAWATPAAIPLTDVERAAWTRIDSIERRPPTFGKQVRRGAGLLLGLATNPDFFHFNRVDGAYVGAGWTWRQVPGLALRTKLGYATGSETWQYRLGGEARLSEAQRLWVGASYHDETADRPTLVSRSYDPTFRALFFRLDPLDYYRDRGATVWVRTKLLDFTRFDLRYNDRRHSSQAVVTDYSLFSVDRAQRPNTPIVDGRLRSVSGSLVYDSRPLLLRRGQESSLPSLTWTRIAATAEVASPDFIDNDFDFRWYSVQVDRRQRTFGLGLTTIRAAAGIATGDVPPQRYFTIDFGMRALAFQGGGFNTVGDSNFTGNRAAMIAAEHDFGKLAFAQSGLPLVRRLPFTLSIHGGAFWTDFVDHTAKPADASFQTARKVYGELGFGIGNLTPFLSPFNLTAYFTWQLSSYRTERFQFGLGLTP